MCLVSVPTLSSATTINILSEQLVVNLKVPDDTYTYTGSAFTAPEWNSIDSRILLPNYDPDNPAPSYFSSTYWGNIYQTENSLFFLGSLSTRNWIVSGDYDPATHVYNSGFVSFYMLFAVEGDGARLSAATLYDESSSVIVTDLTTGKLLSGSAFELLSGHRYHVSVWSQSVNGNGEEHIFELYFGGAKILFPKFPTP